MQICPRERHSSKGLAAPITSNVTVSAPPAPRKPPRLVLRFAIYSAIALALAWVAIFWVVRSEAEERGRQEVTAHATEVAARIAPSLTEADFAGPVPPERRAELDAAFERELVGNLLRMKLWSPEGAVTYSTDHGLIGERADDLAELEPALSGQAVQRVTTLNEESGGSDGTKAFESYVPVLAGSSDETAGVLEVYEAYAPVAADIQETITPVAIALGLALLLLYATLFPILRQVTRALDNRNKGLEQHATALAQALDQRDKAEVRVSEAERNYRSLVEQLPLVMYMTRLDETSSCIYMSPQIEDLVGYTPLECMSDPEFFVKILHPDDREQTIAAHTESYESGEPFSIRYRMIAKDGRAVWIHDEVTIAKDQAGRPMHAQGFLVDITERKNAEETRTRLASIIESSNEAITSASLDLRFTSWNAGAERMFGYPAEEVLGQPVTLLMPPEHQQRALDLLRRVVEEDRVAHFETVRRREDGSRVHVSFTYSPIRNSSGKVVGVSAIGQDVTERKRAEQAIRDSESKFRAFVETTEEWVWAMDVETVHTYSNPAVTRILGYEPEEVVGMAWTEFVLEADREELVRAIAEQAERKEGWSAMVVRCLHRDGSLRFLESTATPDLDAEGELIGWRGTDRDVTGRIQAEADRERLLVGEQEARAIAEAAQRDLAAQNERLRELDRLKDEFIALVSHELRTPLTSIRGYTELLLDGEAGELTDDQRQFLGVVERNSHRLLHLVGDLLFLAQVEAGKLVLDVGALDLCTVASESVETARPQAEAKGITLTLATGPTPPVAGDRARIGQLLDNLVSNAIKFTPDGGRVDVRVRVLRKQAILEVRDSGMGIPAVEQEFLFERFFRTSTATEQAIQGTGLGLAISKAIVDAHEGRITVASEEGAGTTFQVSLPLRRHAEVRERSEVAL